jgi:hypothetical protein
MDKTNKPPRLTKPQAEELASQARGPQSVYGKWRTRVQNSLVSKGLSVFLDDQGKPTKSYGTMRMKGLDAAGKIEWEMYPPPMNCIITDEGRKVLADKNSRVCGRCYHWRQRWLGRDDGVCEAPIPQWMYHVPVRPRRDEDRNSSDARTCEVFRLLKKTVDKPTLPPSNGKEAR